MKEVRSMSSLKEFYEYIKEKKCVCFGAGKKLDEICFELPDLVNKINYILDNNKALDGTNRNINGDLRPIYGVNKIIGDDVSKILLIITCSYKEEIIEQLNNIEILDTLEYCIVEKIFDVIAWGRKKPDHNFKKNATQVIPKKIHYIWFSDNPIPFPLQRNIDGWKNLCEDYEIICWNEKNYDVTKNKYMFQAYKDKRWSFVSDYARLDIIYNHGGIYLDTDVEMIRRPDELLFNDAFIGFERLSTVNTGSGFGAVPYFPLIKEMRDFYEEIDFINHDNPNDMVLCPIYETNLLCKHGLKTNGDFQIVDNMSVYPVMYFNAKSLYSNELKVTEETISIHHCSWTWAGDKNNISKI